jgi:hypothetical protein
LPYSFGILAANQNMILAMNQAQQITAAYDLKEFVSVYTIHGHAAIGYHLTVLVRSLNATAHCETHSGKGRNRYFSA